MAAVKISDRLKTPAEAGAQALSLGTTAKDAASSLTANTAVCPGREEMIGALTNHLNPAVGREMAVKAGGQIMELRMETGLDMGVMTG